MAETRICVTPGCTVPASTGGLRPMWALYHTRFCDECLEKMRTGVMPIICADCGAAQSAEVTFHRNHKSKTGYNYVCDRCLGSNQPRLSEQLRLQDEQRVLQEHQRAREGWRASQSYKEYPARRVLGVYSGEHPPPNQVIYTLDDPLTGEVRYVGHTYKPHQRLKGHLRSDLLTENCTVEKARWVGSLKEQALSPIMAIREYVAPGANVLEREKRWIYHYLHLGASLTNAEAVNRSPLIEAVKSTALDYLNEPLDSPAWAPLYRALVDDWNGRDVFLPRFAEDYEWDDVFDASVY